MNIVEKRREREKELKCVSFFFLISAYLTACCADMRQVRTGQDRYGLFVRSDTDVSLGWPCFACCEGEKIRDWTGTDAGEGEGERKGGKI